MKQQRTAPLLLALIFCGAPASAEERFFARLVGIVSPAIEYTPAGELDSDSAQGTPHYRVSYDGQGRLSSIAFYRAGQASNDAYFGTHRVRYEYGTAFMERRYYDRDDQAASMWRHYYGGGAIHSERFVLDRAGQPISLRFRDTTGGVSAAGSGIGVIRWSGHGEKCFVQTQHSADETALPLTSYFPFERARICLDDRGFLERIENLSRDGEQMVDGPAGFARVVFRFDDFGNELGWVFEDSAGKRADRTPYDGMDHGFAEVAYKFDWTDRSLGRATRFIEYYLDARGQRTANSRGVYEVQYQRNAQGELVDIRHLDEQLAPREAPR